MNGLILSMIGKGISKDNIVYDGNSFWASPYNVPQYITSGLGGAGVNFDFVNYGVGGQSTAQMISDFNSQIAPNIRLNAYKSVIVFFEGINDLYFRLIAVNPNAAQETVNNILSYIDLATSNGFKIIVNTLTPRNNTNTPATYEAKRQEVNSALRLLFPTPTSTDRVFTGSRYGVILCDIGNDPNYGQAGQTSNTTYYNVDLVHPTATMGQSMANDYYIPAINYL